MIRIQSKELLIKTYCLLPIAFCLFLLFTIHCSLFTGNAEAQLAGQIAGKITKVEGRVDILRAGAVKAEPIKVGDAVNVGDILRTKSDGKAEITFIDQSVMSVGPKSRLGVDEYLYKPEGEKRAASLKLYRGRIGFQIPKPVYPAEGSKFEMKTKTAVAGVRGTEGILYTDGVERVYVKDGIIEYSNPLGSVIVTPGRVGEIFHGEAPVKRPYREREYKQQEEGVKPTVAKDEKAPPPPPPTDVPPPPPPAGPLPPQPDGFAMKPPPPPLPITDITLNKTFNVSANILDGAIHWFGVSSSGSSTEGTAAVIQSGSISGTFNQTILEGGYYNLSMNGSYAW
ncbi:FecR family protein, partial [Dissulfurispira sp.]|uniref:FecR family protein n=1 Tax=Dissulfurispira sp. TaxID=2817609 RepID=UPI002FD9623A